MKSWFRGARKAIPEIPDALNSNGLWRIEQEHASLTAVRFDLRSHKEERVYVVIMRQNIFGSK